VARGLWAQVLWDTFHPDGPKLNRERKEVREDRTHEGVSTRAHARRFACLQEPAHAREETKSSVWHYPESYRAFSRQYA
jgi:hypothetical protein